MPLPEAQSRTSTSHVDDEAMSNTESNGNTSISSNSIDSSASLGVCRSSRRQKHSRKSSSSISSAKTRRHPGQLKSPSIMTTLPLRKWSAMRCSFCRLGGWIAQCVACGKGMCYNGDNDSKEGCLPYTPLDLPPELRCPDCYTFIKQIPYCIPSSGWKSGVTGAPVVLVTIMYDENIFTECSKWLHHYAGIRQGDSNILPESSHLKFEITFSNLASKETSRKLKDIGQQLCGFLSENPQSRLMLIFGTHSRPMDGALMYGNDLFTSVNMVCV